MKVKSFLVAAMFIAISAASANAQIQTATLQQEDNVRVFYGIDALKNAVNIAEDGNSIYLSAGNFNTPGYLSKSIKIIGAGGFNTDNSKKTIVQNIDIERNAENGYSDYLELEGFETDKINFPQYASTPKQIKIKKICFNGIGYNNNLQGYIDVEINRCAIKDNLGLLSGRTLVNVVVSNCIINKIYTGEIGNQSSVLITNSIIYKLEYRSVTNTSLQNNIIVADKSDATPNSVNNNIFAGANNFPNVNNQSGNWNNIVLSDLFVNQPENKWDASYDYHLKNPANYIGTDGTQVGIYGGLFPWNTTPGNPQIIESKVSPATSNDGKLDFQIKAEAQQ